ncbi:hypothetical protein SRABI128_00970 [Microbacterium sp. Bi128]|nr:hypothetical protein SRABI128_00970 [Microbacterium sp. Bi128]
MRVDDGGVDGLLHGVAHRRAEGDPRVRGQVDRPSGEGSNQLPPLTSETSELGGIRVVLRLAQRP